MAGLRQEIRQFLNIHIHRDPVDFELVESHSAAHYDRQLIRYAGSEGDDIRAYLFLPKTKPVLGSVVVHHQHHGERLIGKSEVAGIAGDPFQAFCPALAERGIIALAPDSICFEDRRPTQQGMTPDPDPDNDWLQHYNEMAYRLLRGETLMKKVIDDSSIAISLLWHLSGAVRERIGILGHSYGGNTVLFHSPFDERIRYSCSSGAACTYRHKFAKGIGIEMAEVIPGFAKRWDIDDLLALICPRPLLLIAGNDDKYAQDAGDLYKTTMPLYESAQAAGAISYREFEGGHDLDQERFDNVISWFAAAYGCK